MASKINNQYSTSVGVAHKLTSFDHGELHDLRRAFAERGDGEIGTERDAAIADFIEWAFDPSRDNEEDQPSPACVVIHERNTMTTTEDKQTAVSHTPEPWEATFMCWAQGRTQERLSIRRRGDAASHWIAHPISPNDAVPDLATANANMERAVACVNACTGLNPAAVPEVVAIVNRLVLAQAWPGECEAWLDLFADARAALALAKGTPNA